MKLLVIFSILVLLGIGHTMPTHSQEYSNDDVLASLLAQRLLAEVEEDDGLAVLAENDGENELAVLEDDGENGLAVLLHQAEVESYDNPSNTGEVENSNDIAEMEEDYYVDRLMKLVQQQGGVHDIAEMESLGKLLKKGKKAYKVGKKGYKLGKKGYKTYKGTKKGTKKSTKGKSGSSGSTKELIKAYLLADLQE